MKEKITLSLDQHENTRHGEEIFPLQKYVTPLWKEYPYVTAHWHEEAAKQVMCACRKVICCQTVFGSQNVLNRQLLQEAEDCGMEIELWQK